MEHKTLNLIYDQWQPGSGGVIKNINPAHPDQVVSEFTEATAFDVDAAVRAARKALPAWSRLPAPERGKILYRVAELLKRDKEALATLETREMGKTLAETRGDVQEAIDCALLLAGEGRRWFGQTTH